MLEAYIIEELRKRDAGKREDHRPRIELPLPREQKPAPTPKNDDASEGGVVIIEL